MKVQKVAEDLIEKVLPYTLDNYIEKYGKHNAKQLAIICCDLLIDNCLKKAFIYNLFPQEGKITSPEHKTKTKEFWIEVKQYLLDCC